MNNANTTFLEELLQQRLSYIRFLGKQQERILAYIEIRELTQEERWVYAFLDWRLDLETKTCKDTQEELRIARLPVLI